MVRGFIWIVLVSCTSLAACSNVVDEVSWILSLQRQTGSLMLTPQSTSNGKARLNPYLANMALSNVLRLNTNSTVLSAVRKYMYWYVNNINRPDKYGITGTIYDYYVDENDREISENCMDSTDSYGATFLSLVTFYVRASGDREFALENMNVLKTVYESIFQTYDSNIQLTYAKPEWKEAYTMDNVEVWKGHLDFSSLLADLNDPDSEHVLWRALLIQSGIERNLWNPERNEYQVSYKNPPVAVNWGTFYPDATANMWTQVFQLPEALRSPRRSNVYKKFKDRHLTNWINLKSDDFPWCALSEVVRLNEGSQERARILKEYTENIRKKFFPQRKWTWYSVESSFFAVNLNDLF